MPEKTQKNGEVKGSVIDEIVPAQQTGQSSYTRSRIKCRNNYHAQECYKIASQRLLNVNKWSEYAGKAAAIFQLFDSAGNLANRPVEEKDYIRINIPGPDNSTGGGDDWVQVQEVGEKVTRGLRLTFITVRAATDPVQPSTGTAHFFDKMATSTFMIYRKKLVITAAVYGRNEHANLNVNNIFAKIRNLIVYIGAQLGFSKLQWKALTHGLLYANH